MNTPLTSHTPAIKAAIKPAPRIPESEPPLRELFFPDNGNSNAALRHARSDPDRAESAPFYFHFVTVTGIITPFRIIQ
jgi:hypothetical protein